MLASFKQMRRGLICSLVRNKSPLGACSSWRPEVEHWFLRSKEICCAGFLRGLQKTCFRRSPERLQLRLSTSLSCSSAFGSWTRDLVFRRNPVNLFFHCPVLKETAALQDRFAMLDHLRVAAQIRHGVGAVQAPLIGVFPQY